MPTEDEIFILKQIVELRQIQHISLKTLLKSLDTLIVLYQAGNNFLPDIQRRIEIKTIKLSGNINILEQLNKKIETRLNRLEKLSNTATKHKTIN